MKTFNVNLTRGTAGDVVQYPIWGNVKRGARDEPVESFSRFRLRQAGQSYSYGGYNQVLAHALADELYPASSTSVYTAVYLNGDFWGVYSLEERYDSRYLAAHYNEDRRNMIQIGFDSNCNNEPSVQDGNEETAKRLYWEMYDFAKDNDFTNPAAYREFGQKYMNLDDYIDVVLCHIFFNNPDFPGNNNRMWRAAEPRPGYPFLDGCWRQMLYDFDLAFLEDVDGRWKYDQDMLAHFLGVRKVGEEEGFEIEKLNPGWSTLFFRRLMSNPEFRTRFLGRAAYFYNYVLEPARVAEYVDLYYSQLKTMQPFQNNRWMLSVNLEKVRDDFKEKISARREVVMRHFSAHYSQNQNTAFATLAGDPEFDGEKNNLVCSHAAFITAVELELTTAAAAKANQTKLSWEYPPDSGAPGFKEGISEWTDGAAAKKLKVFSGMAVRLSNADPDFVRYEISLDGGGTWFQSADRNHTFTAGTEKAVVRMVYRV